MKTELNRKLPKSSWVPVQPAPLDQFKVFMPPVGDLGTATPPYDASYNVAALSVVYPDEGYDYGDRYGGYQATRFNSSQVDDQEANARADYRYHHASRCPMPAPGFVDVYSAPYSDPNAHGQGLCASHNAPQRERAKRRRHLTAWSASWRGWSAPLLPLRCSFKLFLVSVS
jgi:hypothetical protein